MKCRFTAPRHLEPNRSGELLQGRLKPFSGTFLAKMLPVPSCVSSVDSQGAEVQEGRSGSSGLGSRAGLTLGQGFLLVKLPLGEGLLASGLGGSFLRVLA